MNRVRVTYYGMDGEGATMKEAKADAASKLEKIVSDTDWTPRFYIDGSQRVLIYRELDGWHYSIVHTDTDNLCLQSACADKRDAIRRALRHLAQITWTPDRGLTVPDYVTEKADRADVKSDYKFQLRYRAFAGAHPDWTSCQIHDAACNIWQCKTGIAELDF
jgi:hypothetical protein